MLNQQEVGPLRDGVFIINTKIHKILQDTLMGVIDELPYAILKFSSKNSIQQDLISEDILLGQNQNKVTGLPSNIELFYLNS